MLKLQPKHAVLYQEYTGTRSRQNSGQSLANLEKNKHKNKLSEASVKRLYMALDWLLTIARKKKADNLRVNRQFEFKISMLTLTLPCEQLHDDLYVKKYLLNEFLSIVRVKYNLQNYIWKAEKQGNGSIHFHIIIDKYIFYAEVNKIWNKILDFHGYIAKYRENQEELHKNGFTYKHYKNDTHTRSKQLAAYKKGIATAWRNPTGTTDIHSLKNIKNAKAYLAKYISKNPDVENKVNVEIEAYKKKHSTNQLATETIEEITATVKKKLSINGNLWYISRSLSKLKGIKMFVNVDIDEELQWFKKVSVGKIIDCDFCTVLKISLTDIFKFKMPKLMEKVKNYVNELRSVFYPVGEIAYSPLGLPLNIFD